MAGISLGQLAVAAAMAVDEHAAAGVAVEPRGRCDIPLANAN